MPAASHERRAAPSPAEKDAAGAEHSAADDVRRRECESSHLLMEKARTNSGVRVLLSNSS